MIHTNNTLSRVFSRLADPSNLRDLTPMLLTGRMGVGKRHYFQQFARHLACTASYKPFSVETSTSCTCEACVRLETGRAADYLLLNGTESVEELRESVAGHIHHNPILLPYRFLVLANIHRYTRATLDTLLKTIEEPPDTLKVFATATKTSPIPPAVLSRFNVLRHPDPTSAQLATIIDSSPRTLPFKKYLLEYPFRSVDEVLLYVRHDFQAKHRAFFMEVDFLTLEDQAKAFLADIKGNTAYHLPDVLEFFIEYHATSIRRFCEINDQVRPELRNTLASLPGLLSAFSETLGKHLHSPNVSFFMNLDNQFVSLITSLALLKKMTAP